MIFLSKQEKIKTPSYFSLAGLGGVLALGLVIFYLLDNKMALRASLAEEGLWQEKGKTSRLSFEHFESASLSAIGEESPLTDKESWLKDKPPAPAQLSPETHEGNGRQTTDTSILKKLARELNAAFKRVKYYSRASRQAELEGKALLLITLDSSSAIVEITAEHTLPEELARDLAVSMEKLQRTWRGRYALHSGVAIRLPVTYRLI